MNDQLFLLAAGEEPPPPQPPQPGRDFKRGSTNHTPPDPGTLCRVRGERGDFKFRHASLSSKGLESWTLIDMRTNQFRSFRPDAVRIPRTRRKSK